eukprot:UN05163
MVSRSHFVVLLIAALLDTVFAALLIYLVCRVIKNVLEQSSNEDVDNSISTVIKIKSTNSYKVMIGCNVCGLISFAISTFLCSLLSWIVIITESYYHKGFIFLYNSIFLFYLIGIWIMLYIFVARIDIDFRHSFLSYPRWVIKILYVWVFIIAFLFCMMLLFYMLLLYSYSRAIFWLGPLTIAMHFLFAMTLLCLSCKKVFQSITLRMLQRTENKIDIEAADVNDNNVQIIGVGDRERMDSLYF